ncbi:porin [Enterobacteriaceae endosymbiont of Plateumaris pusilla]|uniref:porin n=1 Tax=Enterobacteriaceae endosymbiont of Plateumaris pusilla TaxID=2675795 RepID=UPI001449E21D|nr:porin [Enterobacteriaceae endosymbiont of Plateumaris pusilla]QJC29587.1 porin [Enterobacteriaceae endosymbiont of Plateumaris pusilla]
MKFNILKILIPFLLLFNIVYADEIYNKNNQTLDLYGNLNVKNIISKKKAKSTKSVEKYNFDLGLKGTSIINDNLKAFGQFEYTIQINELKSGIKTNKPEFNVRYPIILQLGFLGLQYNGMTISYGRNYGILYDTTSYIKKFPIFDEEVYYTNDHFMFAKANNLTTYRNNNFLGLDGLNIALQYQGNNNFNKLEQNGPGWGTSIEYNLGFGINIIGSYFSSYSNPDPNSSFAKYFFFHPYFKKIDKKHKKIKLVQKFKKKDDNKKLSNAYALGIKYNKKNIYLSTVFSETNNSVRYNHNDDYLLANKTKSLEFLGQYTFNDNIQASISYLQSQGYNIPPGSDFPAGKIDLAKYLTIGTSYSFSKNFLAYLGYKISLLNNTEYVQSSRIPNKNMIGLGLTYYF